MARAYSTDLRERVVAAALGGGAPKPEVARRFGVSLATVYAWLHALGSEGRTAPKPHAGGRRPALGVAESEILRALVEEQNDRTLAEYAEALAERTGVRVSRSALDRALGRLELSRKKRRSGPQSGAVRT